VESIVPFDVLYNLGMEDQLKEACRLTGADWVAVARCEGSQMLIYGAYGLSKSKQTALKNFLDQDSIRDWLDDAMKGGDNLSASLPRDSKLDAPKLYVFPHLKNSLVLLVGCRQLSERNQAVWRLVSGLIAPDLSSVENNILPDIQTEMSYDMPRAMERILMNFVRRAAPQGAWLAIRRGDTFDIVSQFNDTNKSGLSLSIDANPSLREIRRTRAEVVIKKDSTAWEQIPHASFKSTTKVWCCLPLIVGQRLIGAVALWRQAEFDPDELVKLRETAKHVSSSVEVIVTFSELTNHLQRLGMFNDFALTVSSAQNVDQIARRVFGLLSRSFSTELISLYIPSADERLVREFSSRDGKFMAQYTAMTGHRISAFLKSSKAIRLADFSATDFEPFYSEARSALLVPLKYRGHVVGLLSIESTRPEAFTQYDEHLMVVIASYLAGLIEYGRLREEAEARARNLGLIHEVVQQILGLNNKAEIAQITAELTAQYFGYELAGVMLINDGAKSPIFGMGGSQAAGVRRELEREENPASRGITGRVFSTGKNILINDIHSEKLYRPLRGWDPGSEICVALKDGEQILGVIDVESSQTNAFSNNDLMAMESLAGVLATVISSADQYQQQLETVRQLRAAQVELKARMNAQQDAERRLLQAAKLAAVGEMAAGIAHELNNPLTTVSGFAELILDEMPADASHRADMELILKEARRARDVVRHLLDFARQGERTRSNADLNEIIEDVLMLTRHLIHTSGVQLTLELAKDLPWVSVDTNQMKQVFLNLIHNALQAMPSGGELEIQTSAKEKDNRRSIMVVVKDSGMGIDVKSKERIFEPFFTTKADRGGTGLGLSVTYGIVVDHGGTIEVESSQGKGSKFIVWLPL
jgi:signal transduction histidine kinase